MFTGIIQCVGRVKSLEEAGADKRLVIEVTGLPAGRVTPGASIAVNGVCLTVTSPDPGCPGFDVSRETLSLTTLGALLPGAPVNLEPALTLGDALGGHLVSGHVDGIGELSAMAPDARSTRMSVRLPEALMRYVARKGSLAVDGVSLTVNDVSGDCAAVNIVPHTLSGTIMGSYRVGTRVNIEVDLISRYLERLLEGRA